MIKFRVIHTFADIVTVIYNTDGYVIDQNGTLYENYGESFIKPVWEVPFDSECKVSLFTGLKDKNDKEIYDGDILRFYPSIENSRSCVWKNLGHIWIRNISDGAIISYNHPYSESSDTLSSIIDSFWAKKIFDVEYEVVGNIYENSMEKDYD